MPSRPHSPQPDPGAAVDPAAFREQLKKLQAWAGFTSLHQLESAAERAGVSMPVSTANRALNADKLPTAEFVRRFVTACGGDLARWRKAREALADALADARYPRDPTPSPEPPGPSAVCPFPGLASFGPGQARYFFGREPDTAALVGLLAERLGGGGPLIVVGPSGAGKSSLLGAGLTDAVTRGRLPGCAEVPLLRMTPGAAPFGGLAEALAPLDVKGLSTVLTERPQEIAEVLTDPSTEGPRAILVVDQFEEAFTLGVDDDERRRFVTTLCAVSAGSGGQPPLLVVIGLRADFYGRCTEHDGLVDALRHGHLPLGAMGEAQLREAIEQPAAEEGLTLEPGLVDLLLRDIVGGAVGSSGYQAGALPLLAHALRATWQQRDGTTLTVAGYQRVGGITGAVSRTAERAYQQLDVGSREVARAALLRLVRLGQDTGDVRRRIRQTDLLATDEPASVEPVLDALIQARLLTTDGTNVEIIHEALLGAWPRLHDWIEADRAGLLADEQVLAAAQVWDRDGRRESDLYRGPRLAMAQDRRTAARLEPPPVVTRFLDAATVLEQAERDAAAARDVRLRRLVAVLAVLLVLALGATVFAVVGQYDLRREAAVIASRKLAADAAALRGAEPSNAAQLALVAHDISATPEAAGAVLSGLLAVQRHHRSNDDAGGPVNGLAVSPDGDLLASADSTGIVRLWRFDAQRRFSEVPLAELPHPGPVSAVEFDPTGRFLATAGAAGLARLYPVADLARGIVPVPREFPATGKVLAISPVAGLVAVGGPSNSVVLWDVGGPQPVRRGEGTAQRTSLTSAAWDRSGATLATASLDGTVQLWDISDPDRLRAAGPIDARVGFVNDVAFRPDGQVLATGHQDGSTRLWDVTDRDRPTGLTALAGHSGPVTSVAFAADGRLATAGSDRTAQLWDVQDAAESTPVVRSLAGDGDGLNAVAFFPDGAHVATAGAGRTVRLWETDVDRARTSICAGVETAIPPEVWERYLPDRAYDPPCAGEPADVRAASPAPPGSVQIVARHSGKCIAIREGTERAGAEAYQVPCDGTPGTRWFLRPVEGTVDSSGPFRLVNAASGHCLESSDSDRLVGAASRATQRLCAEVVGQAWQFELVSSAGETTRGLFRNLRGDRDCLDVNGNTTADDTPIIRWPCGRSGNQIFEVPTAALGG